MNQVLKAAMAINAQVLSEMEIPENYIESLPKVESNTESRDSVICHRTYLCCFADAFAYFLVERTS